MVSRSVTKIPNRVGNHGDRGTMTSVRGSFVSLSPYSLVVLLIFSVAAVEIKQKRRYTASRYHPPLPKAFQRKTNFSLPTTLRTLLDHRQQRRSLQEQQATCSLCGRNNNYTLFSDRVPVYPPFSGIEEANLTCQDFAWFVQDLGEYSEDCLGVRSYFFYACCDAPPQDECERQLRTRLLDTYDSAVPPSNTTTPTWPIDVQFHLEFFFITELDVQASTNEIFVWITMLWQDARLAWDLANDPCGIVTRTSFRASLDVERTEIWVPDVDLYNQENGVQKMPEAAGEVYSDGTVLWRRNGPLKALCLFSGLRRMPFDTLGCQYIIGGWTRPESINLVLADGTGFGIGNFQAKYAEYRIVPDRMKSGYDLLEFELEGGEIQSEQLATGVYYDFYFERATRFYVIGIVIPSILFTTLSFGMFLLDLRVGERLSYGMALLLVLAAHQIVTASYLPVTEERLWAVVLINASFYWVVIGLLESVLVAYLFFVGKNTQEDDRFKRHGNLNMLNGEEPPDGEMDRESLYNVAEEPSEEEDKEEPPLDRRQGLKTRHSVWSTHTLKQSLMFRKRDVNSNRKLIRSIDKWSFRIVPTSYFIFVIVLFCTLPAWEESGDDIWADL